jgi:predicted Zn finger-like uncharacterized protein
LLTQCPNCETTFRVTSEILRVAQGQVRCGRCQTQFDALQRLIEERSPESADANAQLPRSDIAPPSSADIEVEEPETHEEITMEGKHIEISGTYRVLDDDSVDGEPHLRQEVVEEWMEIDDAADDDAATPQGYVDVSDEIDATGAFDATGTYEDIEVPAEQPTQDLTADDFATTGATENTDPAGIVRASRRSSQPRDALLEGASVASLDAVDDLASLNARQRQPSALIWKLTLVPLLLLLVAQVLHHNRAELARHPRLGTPLMNIYNALQLDLTPDWQLHAYEIKQWGVITDPSSPGALKVRASITNKAAFAQPYPLLRLVLEDRWGERVRAREFNPVEDLDVGTPTERLLTPNQQVNATIVIVDPGPDAEGFRFDVCLRGAAGTVCAADLPQSRD